MEPYEYVRKSFKLEAHRVTDTNMAEISGWARGKFVNVLRRDGEKEPAVRVVVESGKSARPQMAFEGDWVALHNASFKIYKDPSFKSTFSSRDEIEIKRQRVLELVKKAMAEQDAATYHGHGGDCIALMFSTVDQIMEIL